MLKKVYKCKECHHSILDGDDVCGVSGEKYHLRMRTEYDDWPDLLGGTRRYFTPRRERCGPLVWAWNIDVPEPINVPGQTTGFAGNMLIVDDVVDYNKNTKESNMPYVIRRETKYNPQYWVYLGVGGVEGEPYSWTLSEEHWPNITKFPNMISAKDMYNSLVAKYPQIFGGESNIEIVAIKVVTKTTIYELESLSVSSEYKDHLLLSFDG